MSWKDRMALYVGYLVNSSKHSCTVCSYISAIKAILAMNGIELDPDQYLLTSLTRACKVVNDQVWTCLPLKKHVLTRILSQIWIQFSTQPYLSTMYAVLFSPAYFGLFRVGELTKSPHVVKAIDVKIGINKKKNLFLLRSSKTHAKNVQPQKIKICIHDSSRETLSQLTKDVDVYCPYTLLRNYLSLRPKRNDPDEQFFICSDRSPVMSYNMRSVLKLILSKAGYDAKLFLTHSCRIRRACNLLKYRL